MTILGIPDVVVVEMVDVDLETTVVIHVDVGNEELCATYSVPPLAYY